MGYLTLKINIQKSNETDKPKNFFKAQSVGTAIYYQIRKFKARDMNWKKILYNDKRLKQIRIFEHTW